MLDSVGFALVSNEDFEPWRNFLRFCFQPGVENDVCITKQSEFAPDTECNEE